jgi:hypothetical protein
MLGAGIALLAADCMTQQQRRAVGWTLFGVGLITTLPLAAQVFGARMPAATNEETSGARMSRSRAPNRRHEPMPVRSH